MVKHTDILKKSVSDSWESSMFSIYLDKLFSIHQPPRFGHCLIIFSEYSPSTFRPDTFFEPGLDEFRPDPSKMAYWRLGDSIYCVNMNVYI